MPEEYSLKYLGDPILREVTSFVDTSFPVDLGLIEEMTRTMLFHRGAGLAATQVGVSKRICLVIIDKQIRVLVNPVITSKSPIMDQGNEGCLSIPGFYTHITRPRRVVVDYLTEHFRQSRMLLEDFQARCVQHEIDHLDGKLITDHVSRTQFRRAEALVSEMQHGSRR